MNPPPDNHNIAPWPTKATRLVGRCPIFSIRADSKTSPRTGNDHDFYVIECADWVNIIAVATDQRLVMIQQFRHGTGSVELEIPGGAVDPEDTSPMAAAIRELREETGYEGKNARLIGHVHPNPAIMSNTCRTVLIEECESRHPRSLDSGEDIATRLMSIEAVRGAAAEGRISHALVIAALYHFDLYRAGTAQQ